MESTHILMIVGIALVILVNAVGRYVYPDWNDKKKETIDDSIIEDEESYILKNQTAGYIGTLSDDANHW
jgi:hypothetical protein